VIFVNGTLLLARIGSLFDQYIIDGIVDGSAALTRFGSWLNGLFDNYIIDGLVNAVANITFWVGNRLRRIQTGNINGYLYGILIAMAFAIILKVRYWS
jgi:NADH-quinone oxidoreductase subunit L